MSSKLVALLVSSVLLPVTALAHPGHGQVGQGWTVLHYAAEPLHVAGGIGLLAAGLLGFTLARRGARRLPTRGS